MWEAPDVRALVAATAAVLVGLVLGCGGSDDTAPAPHAVATAATGAPEPREPLAAASKRLERALAHPECKPLAALLLHSIKRGVDVSPAAPPTAAECRYVVDGAAPKLAPFRVTRVTERGPAGVTEGVGTGESAGKTIDSIWALDADGSWKQLYSTVYSHQEKFPTATARYDDAAAAFVRAVRAKDCAAIWRLLQAGSRFVGGDRSQFCAGMKTTFREKRGGFADIAANPPLQPRRLLLRHSVGLYGLSLDSGRYLVMVVSGGLTANAGQHGHALTSVSELVSARLPAGS
jgi:hypothetical protein